MTARERAVGSSLHPPGQCGRSRSCSSPSRSAVPSRPARPPAPRRLLRATRARSSRCSRRGVCAATQDLRRREAGPPTRTSARSAARRPVSRRRSRGRTRRPRCSRRSRGATTRASSRTPSARCSRRGPPPRLPGAGGGVPPAAVADPRSPESHGRFLRSRGYAPMLDPSDADACGTCHAGVATRPAGIALAAPGAPSCTSCHTTPEGALGCGTCHGQGTRAHPPRDRCFFPSDPIDRAHAAHAEPSASRAEGLACSTCHPTPTSGAPAGVHANGWVDVWFDFAVAGREAVRCRRAAPGRATRARARAGVGRRHDVRRLPRVTAGRPSAARAAATTGQRRRHGPRRRAPRERKGRPRRRERPAAARGSDDPWRGPAPARRTPIGSRPVACETCHAVPSGAEREGKGQAGVRLAGLAGRGGRRPSYDPATKTCAGTYCHEGAGATRPAPRWTDTSPASCASCHGAPPPAPHAQSTACGGAICHQGRTDGLTITPAGRLRHVDGSIDRSLP